MTFVSAVLSNSFKSRIASLFSMNLSRLFHCSVIKVLCFLLLFSNFYILPDTQVFVNNFFIFSFKLFCILYFNSSFRLTYLSYPVNNFFTFSWQKIYIKNRRIPCRLHVFLSACHISDSLLIVSLWLLKVNHFLPFCQRKTIPAFSQNCLSFSLYLLLLTTCRSGSLNSD